LATKLQPRFLINYAVRLLVEYGADRLGSFPGKARLSITYDNGSENAEHEAVNKALGTASYFCAPYHSWEKGGVESVNGLVRRYIPKGADIEKITEEQIKWIEEQLNNRP